MVSKRHKVFISYYHEDDQEYANDLRDFYGKSKAIIDKSMYRDLSYLQTQTILTKIRREHLLDSTVTVVLVGEHTWGRKWVDWEIDASLRPYAERTINGLVGIYLPNHNPKYFRLTDNIESGYAIALHWDDIEDDFIDAVHTAFNRRRRDDLIDNSRQIRERNAPLKPKQHSPCKEEDDNCFIATATYGTVFARDVVILRNWRDEKLKTTKIGCQLVRIYYKISPPIAKLISGSKNLKTIVRHALNPLVNYLKNEKW